MTRRSVVFQAPGRIDLREDELPPLERGEVAVEAELSAISAGTELHFFRGDIAQGVALDETLGALEGEFHYPATYGYASVGRRMDDGRRVFAFQPHVSHYAASPDALYSIPDELSSEAAALWPSAETAVNLTLDGEPLVGERVLVVGQGVVGLCLTSLLAQFPLGRLWSVDPLALRRETSRELGAERAVGPDDVDLADFDLTFDLSGTASGFNTALGAAGFEARVVAGSWFGDPPIAAELGTDFHRNRVRILSSQVSHLGASRSARWSKSRRMDVARGVLENLPTASLITHRIPVEDAASAYELVAERASDCLQVLLTYT